MINVDVPLDEASSSWWLENGDDAQEDAAVRLETDITVDVAIIGGGYTGLWTALALSARSESLSTVVIEAAQCGSQASGKNGGVVHGYWTSIHRLIAALGADGARTVAAAGSAAQDAVAALCDAHPDAAWWSSHGVMKVSTTPKQDAAIEAVADAARVLGRPDQAVRISRAEVQERCRSPRFRAGVFFPEGATVHPARLVHALCAELQRRRIDIYEQTKALEVRRDGNGYVVVTRGGTVRARSVVLATNSALTGLRPMRHHVTNFSSFAVMTEPAPDALAEIGWTGGEALVDSRMFLHYFRTTPDGRVLMGTGSGAIGFRAQSTGALVHDDQSIARAIAGLRWLLPDLGDVKIARGWGGPIDVSSDHLPFFGALPGQRIFYGCGYSGHGVNAGWIGGQTLASLVLERTDEWTSSPLCRRRPPWLPPEPARYIGGRLVRAAILSCEEADQDGRSASFAARATARLPELLRMSIGTR